jgi:peptidyl-prolyl cis-trans isomerase A (cyclophilin A)
VCIHDDNQGVKMSIKQLGVLSVAVMVMVGCEVRNPITQNRASAVSTDAAPSQRELARTSSDKERAKFDDVDVIKPVGVTRQQMNKRLQQAMRNRGANPSPMPVVSAPKRPLKSTDFTTIKPDAASTALKAPTAADLARYTADLEGEGALSARIVTSMGTFECELHADKTPVTVANFVGLARGLKAWVDPFTKEALVGVPLYQNVLFHRVIPGFMIQGGDPTGTGRGNPGYQIPDEFDEALKHDKPGLLSMANAGPGTGSSQFFIMAEPRAQLDGRHAVFGKCANVALVHTIADVARGSSDRPNKDVIIEKIEIYRALE